jgi:hypothetical protein
MMDVTLRRRADGLGDQTVECEAVTITLRAIPGDIAATIEFDPDSGDEGEYRIIAGDECVWSYVL